MSSTRLPLRLVCGHTVTAEPLNGRAWCAVCWRWSPTYHVSFVPFAREALGA